MGLSPKFAKAVQFAIVCHRGQYRKGSRAPYISHPMAVASLVMEYGGREHQIVAALLHDVVEDCGVSEAQLKRRFGTRAARIVLECSDYGGGPRGSKKPPWRARKDEYIQRIPTVRAETLLVSAADKLHNSRTIAHDVRHLGREVWRRFRPTPPEMVWYYTTLLERYQARRLDGGRRFPALLTELEAAVRELALLAAEMADYGADADPGAGE